MMCTANIKKEILWQKEKRKEQKRRKKKKELRPKKF